MGLGEAGTMVADRAGPARIGETLRLARLAQAGPVQATTPI